MVKVVAPRHHRRRRQSERQTLRVLAEALEDRRLMTFGVTTPLSDVAVTTQASSTLSLAGHFSDPSQTNTTVLMHFQPYNTASQGTDVLVQLSDSVTPQTVANFLSYVNSGAYNNTIIHRSVPGFIIQGGGYLNDNAGLAHITQGSPVQNEFANDLAAAGGAGSKVNVRGTIAMAKLGGDPNSATSEWFFNLADNSSNLDNQNGGFTTFGTVLGTGMNAVDTIAGLPTFDFSSVFQNGAFTDLPLAGNGSGNYGNLVTLQYATANATYAITGNTNPSLFSSVSVVGSQLQLAYAPEHVGSADLTVTATDFNGNTVTDTFTVTVTQPVLSVSVVGGSAVTDNQSSAISLGSPTQGATVSKTLHLSNTGNAAMTFTAPTVPSGYVIPSPADLTAVTLNPGDSVDVTVSSVATNAGGAKTGTLVINSNDPDAAAFHVPLTYTVLTRVASASFSGTAITNNQSTAVSLGTSGAATFTASLTLTNSGTGTLAVNSVTAPAGYSVLSSPGSLAAGQSGSLVLSIDSTTVGTKSGTVTVNTDDPITPAFSFPVSATVQHAVLSVSHNGTTLTDGGAVIDFGTVDENAPTTDRLETFHITNTGNATLVFAAPTIPAAYSWQSPVKFFPYPTVVPDLQPLVPGASVDVQIAVRADTGGDKIGTLVLNTNDPNTAAFDIPMAGHVNYRKLEVTYNGSVLSATSSNTTNVISAGAQTEGTPLQLAFHIANTGDAMDLTNLNFSLPAGFSLDAATPLPADGKLAPGQSVDVLIDVDGPGTGLQTGKITLNSNDPAYTLAPSGFNIPVNYTTHWRRLEVDTTSPGQSAPASLNFDTTAYPGNQFTYVLKNTGDLTLDLSGLSTPAGFTATGFPASLAPGASANVVVALDTSGARGPYSGNLTFSTNDPRHDSVSIALAGTVRSHVVLTQGATDVTGGTSVNFGSVEQGDAAPAVTYHIANTGNVSLNLSNVVVPNGFTLTGMPATLAPGAAADVAVTLDTTKPRGVYAGTLSFSTDDPANTSVALSLSGRVLGKGIVVSLAGSTIPYGAASTVDFGKVRRGTTGKQVTFTVRNSGVDTLVFQPTNLPQGYTVISGLPDTLGAGQSVQFTVALDATTAGTFNDTLHIVSSDPDRPSFNIPLAASVSLPVVLGKGGVPAVTYTDADGTLTTITLSGLGSATLDFFGAAPTSKTSKAGTAVSPKGVTLGSITLAKTTLAASKLIITTKGGDRSADLTDISGTPLASLSAPTCRLTGTVSLNVKSLEVKSANGGTINLSGAGSSITIDTAATNLTITAAGAVKSVKAQSWTGGSISAASLDSLTTDRDFNGSVSLRKTLGSVAIKGAASGNWTVGTIARMTAGAVAPGWNAAVTTLNSLTVNRTFAGTLAARTVGTLAVTGAMTNATVRASGKIASLSAQTLNGSKVYAGVDPASNPPATAAVWSGAGVISSLSVKSFVNSSVAAKTLSKASLGRVTTHNSGRPFGVASSNIVSLSASLDGTRPLALSHIKSATTLATQIKAQKVPTTAFNDLRILLA